MGIKPAPPQTSEQHTTGNSPLIELRGIEKVYPMGEKGVTALSDIDLEIHTGELLAVMGPSGSGKSTLMNILGCLDNPSAGTYKLSGRDVSHLGERDLALVRNREIGFVFQSINLLPRATALANVELPLVYGGVPPRERRARATAALQSVGVLERAHHQPSELSGGQRQRVAIARALATQPKIVLADEPTGNLDSTTADEILRLFLEIHTRGNTVILVTHSEEVARLAHRILYIRDGKIERDERDR
jgi:putative ABC transport system ATP-binding protein